MGMKIAYKMRTLLFDSKLLNYTHTHTYFKTGINLLFTYWWIDDNELKKLLVKNFHKFIDKKKLISTYKFFNILSKILKAKQYWINTHF